MTEKTLGQIAYEAFTQPESCDGYLLTKNWDACAQAVIEVHESRKWQPIESAPHDDGVSFLVLLNGNECCKSLTLQVQKFEGRMYPDRLDFNVDEMDIVTGATHWQPLPTPQKQEGES